MKVVNDWSLVIIACIVALIFTGGIIGVRRGNVCLGALRRAFRETVPETLADAEGPGTSGRGRKGDGVKRKSSEAPSVKA